MGAKEGGSGQAGTRRRQESRGGEDGASKGGDQGCGEGRRPESGPKEVPPGKGCEGPGQEGCESSGQESCEEGGVRGVSTEAGSRGAVGFGHRPGFRPRAETICEKHQPGRDCSPLSRGENLGGVHVAG